MSYLVTVATRDRGLFEIRVEAPSPGKAESIASQAVRYQFSHSIIRVTSQPIG
jgi:hypothetical protein